MGGHILKQNNTKTVKAVDVITLREYIFNSAKEASEELCVPYSSVSACCRKKQKTSCGFRFYYV